MSTANGSIGTVNPIDITSTMQEAYLDYAMSVIVARALPDVRDGLKPVHRRILYAMSHDLNLVHTGPHKKSARIVGEVLGKYHPHGDTAVYDAMVRMAQDFSLRYPLVDGQGNFGSIDGDNAAAMRYTEARLAEISSLMLADLEKDTVEWHDNFDNSLREPDILPAALPNLLINGASGIAVGMATNIPPHNLGEVVDALTFMIDRYHRLDEVTVEDLLHFIKGPDFPTGGILYRFREEKNSDEVDVVAQGYSVGKARMILQAKAHFEEMSRNRSRIVITELPYQTNKTALIERIAGLVRDGKVEGITDLRDESDRTGMRIVIELTRNAEPKLILADLFKYTPLQQTFGMQMLALVDGQPRMLGLKRMLHLFIQHREEIIRRRSEYDLTRARERAHILEGLLKALDILDEVIAVIRKSQRVDTARTNLMREFGFTQIQAQAILDMQLRRLAALERKRLQDEYDDLRKFIAYLEDLLAHPEKILALIREDLLAIKEKYGDARRTQIVDRTKGTLTSTDLLPEQDVWVSVAENGDLRRADMGKLTKSSAQTKAKISQVALLQANTRDYLHLFASDGRSARVAIHETPREQRKHLSEFTNFSRRDDINAALSLPRLDASSAAGYLFCVTEKGVVKRVTLADFLAAAPSDPSIMNVDGSDRLAFVFVTRGEQEVILVAEGGKSIRFSEEDVRSMGLAAGGVGGMKLKKGERIVYAGIVDDAGELMTVTEKGYIKRSALDDYSRQGRNGGGIVTHKLSGRTGKIAAATVLTARDRTEGDNWLAVVTVQGQAVMLTVSEVPAMGRSVLGKQLVQIGVGDRPCAVRVVADWTGDDGPSGELAAAPASDSIETNGGALPIRGNAAPSARVKSTVKIAAKAGSKPRSKTASSAAHTQAKPKSAAGGDGPSQQASLGFDDVDASPPPRRGNARGQASKGGSAKAGTDAGRTARSSTAAPSITSPSTPPQTKRKKSRATQRGAAKKADDSEAARAETPTSTVNAEAPKPKRARQAKSGASAASASTKKSVVKPAKSRSTKAASAAEPSAERKPKRSRAKPKSATNPKSTATATPSPSAKKTKRVSTKAAPGTKQSAASKPKSTASATSPSPKRSGAASAKAAPVEMQAAATQPKPSKAKPTPAAPTTPNPASPSSKSGSAAKPKTTAKSKTNKRARKLQTVTTVKKKAAGSGKANAEQ